MPNHSVYYIPNGPKNLAPIFPAIDFSQVEEYYVEVVDDQGDTVATTPINKMSCCCDDEKVRVHFLNYLGTFDGVNFLKAKITHDTTSSEYLHGLPQEPTIQSTGQERYNVVSNDIKEVKNLCYGEDDMQWLQELADSPKAVEEWKGIQSQSDDYLPIKILDGKFEKQKNDKEYNYQFTLQYKLANGFKTIRN